MSQAAIIFSFVTGIAPTVPYQRWRGNWKPDEYLGVRIRAAHEQHAAQVAVDQNID
jgi:hypothetical protein